MKTLGKPEAHSDVINKQPQTLLIGYGWVGQHIAKYFTEAYWTDENKEIHKVSDNSVDERDRSFDLAFVQVPTPMNPDGSCDTSYVFNAVETWAAKVSIFVIRSTVTPGTCHKLKEAYPLNQFVFQPEYIGETVGHPNLEPKRDPFIILGGDPWATRIVVDFWATVLNANATYYQVSVLEAEIVKYMENSFLGIKVLFVNEFAQLCKKVGADFYKVREAWLADPRIGRSHSMAFEDNPGFSGKCLPKDINSIVHYSKKAGKPLNLMDAALKINAKMRESAENTVPLLPEE